MHVFQQALDALKAALERSPGSVEMEQKARQLRRLAAAQQNKENQGGNKQGDAAAAAADPRSKVEREEPASAAVLLRENLEPGSQPRTKHRL